MRPTPVAQAFLQMRQWRTQQSGLGGDFSFRGPEFDFVQHTYLYAREVVDTVPVAFTEKLEVVLRVDAD